jgi:hypothetical protein
MSKRALLVVILRSLIAGAWAVEAGNVALDAWNSDRGVMVRRAVDGALAYWWTVPTAFAGLFALGAGCRLARRTVRAGADFVDAVGALRDRAAFQMVGWLFAGGRDRASPHTDAGAVSEMRFLEERLEVRGEVAVEHRTVEGERYYLLSSFETLEGGTDLALIRRKSVIAGSLRSVDLFRGGQRSLALRHKDRCYLLSRDESGCSLLLGPA